MAPWLLVFGSRSTSRSTLSPARCDRPNGCGTLRGLPALAAAAAVLIACPVVIGAHEAGMTRVTASFAADSTYAIELTTDASTLLARLEVALKRRRSVPVTIEDYRRSFAATCDEISRHVDAAFDGVPVPVSALCSVDDAVSGSDPSLGSLGVTVRLAGAIPGGARQFTWQYGLTSTAYNLMLVASNGQVQESVWLEGGQFSAATSLDRLVLPSARNTAARAFGLGFTQILPRGLDHILFVIAVFLLNRRLRPVLWQVGAFSVAHALAFWLTLQGVIAWPMPWVQPLIALSVAAVALGNLVTSELTAMRIAIVFLSGLLHGVRFAAGWHPEMIGSELLVGALSVVAGIAAAEAALLVAASAIVGWGRAGEHTRRFVIVPTSALIAAVALLAVVERLAS